jgi:hypothetical protein
VNDFARLHQLLLKLAEGLFAEREGDRPNDKVRRHFALRKALHGDVFIEPLVAARRVPEEPRESAMPRIKERPMTPIPARVGVDDSFMRKIRESAQDSFKESREHTSRLSRKT